MKDTFNWPQFVLEKPKLYENLKLNFLFHRFTSSFKYSRIKAGIVGLSKDLYNYVYLTGLYYLCCIYFKRTKEEVTDPKGK
jgi:hypothetical protein